MTWLVVGAAGYIGSHVVHRLRAEGRRVVALDDLSTGDRTRLPEDVPLVVASDTDRERVARALRLHPITGVVHLAARKSVPESVTDPLVYYRRNLDGMRVLLEEMVSAGVRRAVLSSSAAVYGVPAERRVSEETPTVPINPYGETKLVCEWMLRAAGRAHGLSWIALRYFNVVGAEHEALADRSEGSLFPRVFRAVSEARPVQVTGGDLPTRDGSGIRDYVHVGDVAAAHVAAIRRVEHGPAADVYNVGTGRGTSVLEMIQTLREVAGVRVDAEAAPRRPGDPPEVVAAIGKIHRDLAWSARYDIRDMVASAWRAWAARGASPEPAVQAS
jgi:UDP-glucose 4-epimerase